MSTPWWQLGITQAHGQNGELGVDIGTPYHTPLSAIYGGTVLDAGYHAWGGQVDIQSILPNGQKVIEQFLHLDLINGNVKPGASVAPGQYIGLSGGQTSGGYHPVQNRPDFTFSTGPHTEFGLYTGTPGARTALNPTSWLRLGPQQTGTGSSGTASSGTGGTSSNSGSSSGSTDCTPPWWVSLFPPLGLIGFSASIKCDVGNISHTTTQISNAAATVSDIPSLIQSDFLRAGLLMGGLVLLGFGLLLLFWDPINQHMQEGAQKAAQVAKMAAVA